VLDAIATCRRLLPKGDVTFKDLMRVASDLDVRTVTIEGLTSGRYLLPITVGIVTAIATMRSVGLSWSHDTCCFEGEIESYTMRAYRNTSVAGGGQCRVMHPRRHATVKRMCLPRRTALAARQCPGELAYRLLMLLIPDFAKVAGDLELHTLVQRDLPRTFLPDTFVKIGERRAQRAGHLI
jgi:hypothetical protein